MREGLSRTEFAWRVFIGLSLAAAFFIVWKLASVLLLAFGGVVLAVVLRMAAEPLARVLPLPERWAAMLATVLALLLLGAALYFFGREVGEQFDELRRRLPDALGQLGDWLSGWWGGAGEAANRAAQGLEQFLSTSRLMNAAAATAWLITDLLVIFFVAVYVSFDPGLYRRGLLAVAPARKRPELERGFDASGTALRGWLRGQLVSMTTVGLLTWLGLWLVGVPLASALGVIAGLLEFVPILGPWLAAVPGVLLAFTVSPQTALYAALVYLAVQQVEGHIIMPLAQKWAVELPPALAVTAVVALGLLFGLPGVLFATPLVVVLLALVRRLYLDRPPI